MRIISCWETWLISWAALADGLCGILSGGLYTPDASTAVRIWALGRQATRTQEALTNKVVAEAATEAFRIKRLELPLYIDCGRERHDVPIAQNDGWFFMVTGVDTRKIWCQRNGKTYHHMALSETQEQCDAAYEKAFFRELALQNQLELDLGAETTMQLSQITRSMPKPLRLKLEQIICEQEKMQASAARAHKAAVHIASDLLQHS